VTQENQTMRTSQPLHQVIRVRASHSFYQVQLAESEACRALQSFRISESAIVTLRGHGHITSGEAEDEFLQPKSGFGKLFLSIQTTEYTIGCIMQG